MPIRCSSCGHVHWDEAPVLKETMSLIKEESGLSATTLSEHANITLQAASNRLRRLEKLGEVEGEKRRMETGSYQTLWYPSSKQNDLQENGSH